MLTLRAHLFTGLIIITFLGFLYLTYWVATDIRIPGLRGTEESLFEGASILSELVGKQIVQKDSTVYDNLHTVFGSVYKQETGALLYGDVKEYFENRIYITDKKGRV